MTLERSYGDRFMIRAREIVAMDRAQRILCGEYGEGSTWLWIRLAQGLLSRARWIEFWAEERLFSSALTRILDWILGSTARLFAEALRDVSSVPGSVSTEKEYEGSRKLKQSS